MSSVPEGAFVETKQYKFFTEFCNACRKNRYIGLCYGPPGVGKTLSARHYANWDKVRSYNIYLPRCAFTLKQIAGSDVIFHTAQVVNSALRVSKEISEHRKHLQSLVREDFADKRQPMLDETKLRIQEGQDSFFTDWDWLAPNNFKKRQESLEKRFHKLKMEYSQQCMGIKDPTKLIILDEADRLKLPSLDQLRDIFDKGDIGLILIGMPGIEKRLARYPQLYSRVGFVHEFRPLAETETRNLLQRQWCPPGVSLPDGSLRDEGAVAAILRITGGNFRLLHRLLTQIARVLEINALEQVTPAVVEVARESLVIGTD